KEDDVNTLKSAALVLVLLGVLYGVYAALNKPLPSHDEAAHTAGDNSGPLIEYGAGDAAATNRFQASPSLMSGQGEMNPASADIRPTGGAYQPNLDTGSMPPPYGGSRNSPLDPTTSGSSGLQR